MSAANYYQPHVYLDGKLLTESAPARGLAAVANFKIKWGSRDWWNNVDAAELEMTLLDPHGELLGLGAQQRIEIRRDPDDARVFVGSIDEIKSRYEQTTDPATGANRDMWVHKIKASDPLGDLQRDRRRGVEYNQRDIQPYRLHWGPCYMSERKEDISGRSSVPIEWEPTYLDQYDGAVPIAIFPVPAYERNQVVSLLTVLRNTARISHPLNRPLYFPSDNTIRLIAPTLLDISQGTTNRRDETGWLFSLRPANTERALNGTEVMVPGDQLSITGGIATGSALTEQVNRVEITIRATRPTSFVGSDPDRYMENVESSFEVSTPRGTAQMTVQVDSDFSAGFMYEEPQASFRLRILQSLDPVFGAPTFEPLKYKFNKHKPAPAWAEPWLTPEVPLANVGGGTLRPIIYHLMKSLTNWVPDSRPFAVIGGTLTYSNKLGWEASVNQGPLGAAKVGPTLGDIKETQQIVFANDETIIADWQRISTAS